MPSSGETRLLVFFMAPPDIKALLERIEEGAGVKYLQAGSFGDNKLLRYQTFREIPELGHSKSGKVTDGLSLLVVGRWSWVRSRSIAARDGSRRFIVDQSENPGSVVLQPGGIYSGDSIVRGSLGTSTSNASALKLLSRFEAALKETATEVREYFVGNEAQRLHRAGHRLVTIHHGEGRELDFAL